MSEPHHDQESARAGTDVAADVHEIRPISDLKVCSQCLVSNSASKSFCTACGAALPITTDIEEAPTVVDEPWPGAPPKIESTAIAAPSVASPVSHAEPAHQDQRAWWLTALVVVLFAVAVAFAALWVVERGHANKLDRSLHRAQSTLALTRSNLARTKKDLADATSQSERRREAIVQTQDVLQKVDPLLSSVDNVQGKANDMSSQGENVSTDAESFISTVADLVNYMVDNGNDPSLLDYGWIQGEIDTANKELDSIRADEGLFSSDSADYGSASSSFGTEATAFTQAVRSLQKQLKTAATNQK